MSEYTKENLDYQQSNAYLEDTNIKDEFILRWRDIQSRCEDPILVNIIDGLIEDHLFLNRARRKVV